MSFSGWILRNRSDPETGAVTWDIEETSGLCVDICFEEGCVFCDFCFSLENFPSRPGSRLGRRQDSTECPDQQELVPTPRVGDKGGVPARQQLLQIGIL